MDASPNSNIRPAYDRLVVRGQKRPVRRIEIEELVQVASCYLVLACDEFNPRLIQVIVLGSLVDRDQSTPL